MNPVIADSAQAPLAASSGRAPAATTVAAPRRNVAVDAYRGLVMLLMMGEVMQCAAVVTRLSRTVCSGASSPSIKRTSSGPAVRCTT